MAGNGSVRWLRLITIVGASLAAVVSVITILWQLFSIANSVTAQASKNEEFSRRLASIETAVSRQDIDLATLGRDFNEVETQFCSADSMKNLTHASDLRLIAVLWEKVFDKQFPIGNAFYPTVCRPRK